LDLRGVVTALPTAEPIMGILAPANDDETLAVKMDELRAEGNIVVQALADIESNFEELNCNRKLTHYNSGWHVVSIDKD
jgi:ATP phosphoribosyltransferase regulatory subunit